MRSMPTSASGGMSPGKTDGRYFQDRKTPARPCPGLGGCSVPLLPRRGLPAAAAAGCVRVSAVPLSWRTRASSARAASRSRSARPLSSRAAAQLRLAAVGRRVAAGEHLSPARAPDHHRDRDCLPQAASAGHTGRCHGDGPHFPGVRGLVTQLATQGLPGQALNRLFCLMGALGSNQ
jgi:hypothetical protein